MILADKILELRKRNGWSQEDLAIKLGVSRQAVSKWEGAQSMPDMERIIAMSRLFGVMTDVLVKDEIDITEKNKPEASENEESGMQVYKVSLEEANAFLSHKFRYAKYIALGVFLCIMSALPLVCQELFLPDKMKSSVKETLGMVICIAIVTCAVAIFIVQRFKGCRYKYLYKEHFETAYGVDSILKERLEKFMSSYVVYIVVGVILCMVAFIFLISADILSDFYHISSGFFIMITIILVAIAVYLFVVANIIHSSYSFLLQQGNNASKKRMKEEKLDKIMGGYWLIVVCVYLSYSFITGNWDRSWIIFPIAGVACGLIDILFNILSTNE